MPSCVSPVFSQGLAAFGRGRNYAAAGPMTPARRGHRKQLCYHGAEGGGQLVDAARRGENEDLVAQRLGQLAEHELQYLPVRLLREKRAVGGTSVIGAGRPSSRAGSSVWSWASGPPLLFSTLLSLLGRAGESWAEWQLPSTGQAEQEAQCRVHTTPLFLAGLGTFLHTWLHPPHSPNGDSRTPYLQH